MYDKYSELIISSTTSLSLEIEQELLLLPPMEALFPLFRRGEFGLFDNEARGTGLVKPMLLLPFDFPADDTVIVTGDEEEEAGVFTIFAAEIVQNEIVKSCVFERERRNKMKF